MANPRLYLDPWPAEYESSFQIDEFDEDGSAEVDHTVEGTGWQEISPGSLEGPSMVHFVDGVRRVEARIIVDDDSGRLIRGLFGSVGAGAVRIEQGNATFETLSVARYLVTTAATLLPLESLKIGNAELVFEPVSTVKGGPNAAVEELQTVMRTQEAALALALASESECVFADGPLHYFSGGNHPAVGVIKRLIEPYLSAAQFDLVRKLQTGQRTPLFLITKGKDHRYSWYLRVGTPRVMDHDVAGVLRLEVRTGVGLNRAIELANLSASFLPGMAAESFRDPRSPQNLMPIGALEHELRHRLGDGMTIRRAIEERLFTLSRPA
ncbi:MAG TPA: hypothetical protein VG778_01335 [Blastocatellia bacterium]|jgi:hypothetical protein|nr:hypothetical protein [Blastocatellia bacterium]